MSEARELIRDLILENEQLKQANASVAGLLGGMVVGWLYGGLEDPPGDEVGIPEAILEGAGDKKFSVRQEEGVVYIGLVGPTDE